MAGKYFEPVLSFCNSCRILLLPGAKLTCLTLGADLKLFVAFPHIVKSFWDPGISTAMSLFHAGDALGSFSAAYLTAFRAPGPALPVGAACAAQLCGALCRLRPLQGLQALRFLES